MCGIAGTFLLAESSERVSPELLVRMRDTMVHRGPDGGGLWISPDQRVGLAHRRLAIIDLTTVANQPMCNEDGSLWVVFNGEIYNHADVRTELEQIGGHTWKTNHSDTEVILHAFEQWGIDCLQKFRGMFAIAIWDAHKKQLWLIRDRAGEKPLYYSLHHGRLQFASEIKALLADPQQKRAVNEEALYHYLSFITTPAPQTLFDGIKKLPAATWLRIDADGNIKQQQYWDVWDNTQPLSNCSETEICERLLDELRTTVNLRKVSDVPVGVFLSGGIDSSTNAALFSDGGREKIKTFTIGYEGAYKSYQNELHFAQMMADQIGADHHVKLLTVDDLLNFLPRMIHLQDEPIGDPVCVPVYYVSKLARDNGVVVCQVGEGADELFWGYPTWRTKLRLQRLNDSIPTPRLIKNGALAALRILGQHATHPYEALRRATESQPVFWGGVDAFTEHQKQKLLSPRMRSQFAGFTSWEALKPLWQRFQANAWEPSALNWMTYVDLNLRLPELLLMRVDKMSMGVSLEGRVPFLDHKFIEFAMSIPESTKTRNGTLKHILKKAVRGIIPDQLIDRKKQGFGVPVYEWLFDRLGPRLRTEINHFCDETDFLDRREVNRLLDANRGSTGWYLLNIAMWWKHYIAESHSVPLAA